MHRPAPELGTERAGARPHRDELLGAGSFHAREVGGRRGDLGNSGKLGSAKSVHVG